MAIESPGSVAQELVANNVRVGKQVIGAYRAATGYFVSRVDGGMKKVLDSAPAARLNAQTRRNIGVVGERVAGLCATTFGRVSDGADRIVDQIGHRTSGAIGKVAARLPVIDNKYATRYVGLVSRVSLPPLKFARDLSDWVASRAEQVEVPRPTRRRAVKTKHAVRKGAKRARA